VPTQSNKEKRADEKLEKFHLTQRQVINRAYGSLQGRANADTFRAFTFEEALDAHIEEIEGETYSQAHPNKLDRVSQMKNDIVRIAEELKTQPPETFALADDEDNVNT
jgi:hypothetical protein